jgi:POT family proton-dependent oligopeptide transporter
VLGGRPGPTLFYLGINLGAFVGPLITGLLQTRAGFHYGFGAAAVGMALGLAQYVAFRRNWERMVAISQIRFSAA